MSLVDPSPPYFMMLAFQFPVKWNVTTHNKRTDVAANSLSLNDTMHVREFLCERERERGGREVVVCAKVR